LPPKSPALIAKAILVPATRSEAIPVDIINDEHLPAPLRREAAEIRRQCEVNQIKRDALE
jgi:hypothetical protein